MTIGIDLRCLPADGSAGAGVAHAARFLTYELLAQEVLWSWRLYIPSRAKIDVGAGLDPAHDPIPLKDASGSALRAALREYPCDILFVPGGSIAPGLKIPCIPWVHDMAIFDHPEWFAQSFLRRRVTTALFRRGVERAPVVFAVSEDTKRALISKFNLNPKRVLVTYEGGDPILALLKDEELAEKRRAAKKSLAALGITNTFILILGTVEPRKNIAMLIQAWRDAGQSFNRAVDLVIAGREGCPTKAFAFWRARLNARQKRDAHFDGLSAGKIGDEAGGHHLHRIAALDDETRRDLLLAADLVALPSLHEGFSLVALEAMQAGTALVASRAGAIPEVVGNEGALLDPKDVSAWSKALVGLMNDEPARFRLAHAGKIHSKHFTWEKSARIVADGIKEIRNRNVKKNNYSGNS